MPMAMVVVEMIGICMHIICQEFSKSICIQLIFRGLGNRMGRSLPHGQRNLEKKSSLLSLLLLCFNISGFLLKEKS